MRLKTSMTIFALAILTCLAIFAFGNTTRFHELAGNLRGLRVAVPCSSPLPTADPFTTFVDSVRNPLAPFHTLQDAIDASRDGDTIAICPGLYEGFEINGKELTLNGIGSVGDVKISSLDVDGIAQIRNDSLVTIANLSFKNGQSTGENSGGLTIFDSNVTILNSHFENNLAYEGGAIYIEDTVELSLDEVTFSENQAEYRGGAIAGYAPSVNRPIHIAITNCDFRNNKTTTASGTSTSIEHRAGGGALALDGDDIAPLETRKDLVHLNITDTQFEGNTTEDLGGAINLASSTVVILNSGFTANKAKFVGGAFYAQVSTVLLDGTHWTQNLSAKVGGAIGFLPNDPSPFSIFNSEIENNQSLSKNTKAGGAIFVMNNTGQDLTTFEFQNTTIRNNTEKNCFNVSGNVVDLGQNIVDDSSCF